MNITDKMLEQDHLKDDACPKCGVMYCADSMDQPLPYTRETPAVCVGCGYKATLGEFIAEWERRMGMRNG